MERAGFRLGVVGLRITGAAASAIAFTCAAQKLERPKRVGVHLEFPADHGADEALMAGLRRSLPRLLASAQAEDVQVGDVDASTLELTFVPPAAWSEIHGLRADGADAAPELVPDGLRMLLTSFRDLRVLEIADAQGGVDRDRAVRLFDHHPERALQALSAALQEAQDRGRAVAWIPRASASGELVPVVVEGSHDRRITVLDLASAKRGAGANDIELGFDALRRKMLESYAAEIAGRRVAIVVDGAVEGIGVLRAHDPGRFVIEGENGELASETCAAIVAHVREPLAPRAPRITRSWILPEKSIAEAVVPLVIGASSALLAAAMAMAFARDLRRRRVARKEADWSSAA